jgi:hypothetical protein
MSKTRLREIADETILVATADEIDRLRAALAEAENRRDEARAALAEAERKLAVVEDSELCEAITLRTKLAEAQQYRAEACARAERAESDVASAWRVIEPFAEAARWYDRDYCTGDVVLWQSRYGISVSLKVDHLWAARDFFERTAPPPPEAER